MRYCKYLIIFIVAVLPAKLFSQDITGLWKGTLYNDTTKKYYRYEIGISEEKGKLSGFSHTYFLLEDKEFYGVKKIKIKKVDGKIIVEDAGLIANNYPVAPAKNVRQLNVLTLEIKDSVMILSGPFTTNRTKEYSSLTGTINLQRKNDFWQSALVPHLQELGLSNDLSFVKKENDLAKAKEEAEIIAAQKELVAKNEQVKKEEAIKNEIKAAEAKKEIAANSTVSKKETIKEIKTNEPSKEIVSNINPSKAEANKKVNTSEIKANEPAKEIVSNTTTPRKETNTETKPAESSKEIVSKPIEAKTETKNETKSNESKPATPSTNNTLTKTTTKETQAVIVKPTEPAAEVDKRANIVQQTVYFTADSLQISLYDNGEVDGDTVSVLMNGKIIMAKAGLSTNAVRKTIYAGQEQDSIQLVMYAENLGSIAPNTGLLVVHDGKSIYEIRFSGDEKECFYHFAKKKKVKYSCQQKTMNQQEL